MFNFFIGYCPFDSFCTFFFLQRVLEKIPRSEIYWLDKGGHMLLEGDDCPAEFPTCPDTLPWKFLVIMNTLISWFRCVWLRMEITCRMVSLPQISMTVKAGMSGRQIYGVSVSQVFVVCSTPLTRFTPPWAAFSVDWECWTSISAVVERDHSDCLAKWTRRETEVTKASKQGSHQSTNKGFF